MRWRLLLLLPALLLTAAANLRLQWDCELAGEALAKGCAGFAVQKALRAARTAAEEILPGEAALPEPRLHLGCGCARAERTPRSWRTACCAPPPV